MTLALSSLCLDPMDCVFGPADCGALETVQHSFCTRDLGIHGKAPCPRPPGFPTLGASGAGRRPVMAGRKNR